MFSNSSSSDDSPQPPPDPPESKSFATPMSTPSNSQQSSSNRPRSYSQGNRGMSKVAPFMNTHKKPTTLTDKVRIMEII